MKMNGRNQTVFTEMNELKKLSSIFIMVLFIPSPKESSYGYLVNFTTTSLPFRETLAESLWNRGAEEVLAKLIWVLVALLFSSWGAGIGPG